MIAEKSIMDRIQEAAEKYFSGPIPDGNAYLGENIRKNYHVIQRAAAEWGAKWIAKEAGIKTYSPSLSDQFISYLDEEIDHSIWIKFNMPKNSEEYKRAADGVAILTMVKEKYLSLLNQQQ